MQQYCVELDSGNALQKPMSRLAAAKTPVQLLQGPYAAVAVDVVVKATTEGPAGRQYCVEEHSSDDLQRAIYKLAAAKTPVPAILAPIRIGKHQDLQSSLPTDTGIWLKRLSNEATPDPDC